MIDLTNSKSAPGYKIIQTVYQNGVVADTVTKVPVSTVSDDPRDKIVSSNPEITPGFNITGLSKDYYTNQATQAAYQASKTVTATIINKPVVSGTYTGQISATKLSRIEKVV